MTLSFLSTRGFLKSFDISVHNCHKKSPWRIKLWFHRCSEGLMKLYMSVNKTVFQIARVLAIACYFYISIYLSIYKIVFFFFLIFNRYEKCCPIYQNAFNINVSLHLLDVLLHWKYDLVCAALADLVSWQMDTQMQVINSCEKEALINRTKIKYMMSYILLFQRSGSLMFFYWCVKDQNAIKPEKKKHIYFLIFYMWLLIN